ncbi:MAG: response regulator [Hyphomonas sp.]|uniref:ATP-binding response regulator n=1 Tax=Hyphomonas sp. TaxID=87 RepID=UPI00352708D6
MALILIVDDVPLHGLQAATLLQERPGWRVAHAEDGLQALRQMREQTPDLVLTDIQMPELNGLQLVEAIQREFVHVPVILMTGHGSEEIAAEALRVGAASYVPKRDLVRDLVETVAKVLSMSRALRNQQQVLECLVATELTFLLSNDPGRVQPLVGYLQDHISMIELVDQAGVIRIGTALHEAVINAMEHGNLQVSSELRESDDFEAYRRLVDERRQMTPYRDRRVHVSARFTPQQATFVVRDEGPGFDTSSIPDPRDPANLERCSGRGLYLIRTFMDQVSFGKNGTEITMTKFR